MLVSATVPGLGVDDLAAVVAEGGRVALVPHLLAAVLVDVAAGVAALAGVDLWKSL